IEDYPAKIAEMLLNGLVDVALVPVVIIPQMKEYYIITDFCIASNGPVASVGLFSDVPVEKIKKVYLDYQSRTSVMLAKILLKEYWKQEVKFINATSEEFQKEIVGSTAGVIIGDRALEQRLKSKYIYDLGEAWKHHTGLPFVFAAWISNKRLPADFIIQFNEANAFGVQHLNEVIAENPCTIIDLNKYYTECISYKLDEGKKVGLKLFLEKLTQSN
ncbi:MAG: menaquinone biosynthesis protein, partial [Bacteroidota bacterium]|nr:menaquinone biosynthesis protein [Bacteroidota bacterium]